MEKEELIMITAKEIFLKMFALPFPRDEFKQELLNFDERFKRVVRTIADAYKSINQ